MTDLKWPWFAVLLAAVVAALLLLWLRRPRQPRGSLLVAHASRLTRLSRYRALTRRQIAVTALRTAATLVVVAGAILLAARPMAVVVTQPDRSGRDIELCLDVSPSMYEWDQQIIEEFGKLVDDLSGERIGLTIFNATGVTIFPLTDDYEFMRDRLDEAAAAFDGDGYGYFVGTLPLVRRSDQLLPEVNRASQIGDGLVSCLQRFDEQADARGRAVVLASDNDPLGPPLFDLGDASAEAIRDGVVVYGIAPPDLSEKPEDAKSFDAAVTSTGGTLSLLQEDTNVDSVVAGIQRLERARLDDTPPTATEVDDPAHAVRIASGGLTLLVLSCFLRRRT